MNQTFKKVLIISAKHAVNAILTNAALAELLPNIFNFHSSAGLLAFGKAALATVAAREASVWLPVVLKWTQENLNLSIGGNTNA